MSPNTSMIAVSLLVATSAFGRVGPPPTSHNAAIPALAYVEEFLVDAVDIDAVLREDDGNKDQPAGLRFAVPVAHRISPANSGTWHVLADGSRIWRLSILSPEALSINLTFERFVLPPGATVHLYNPQTDYTEGPFTHVDNDPSGQFWTPLVLGDQVVVEMFVPVNPKGEPELTISHVNHGFRYFGETRPNIDQGACNIDVVCPEGDDWRSEIKSEATYSLNGFMTCSGQMLNSVPGDQRNFFLTADHCGIRSGNASSMVVYWNYESPQCGDLSGGDLSNNQQGATWRAGNSFSDFTLVELDDRPDPDWQVSYSGWSATGAVSNGCVAIHHPGTDEKAISFNTDDIISDSYLGNGGNDNSHWQVNNWELGTTEPGSSGSGIWDTNHRLVGQLHGGYASCSSITADWYGRFSVSWDHGNSSTNRLKDWLDPLETGTLEVDTADPNPPSPNLRYVNAGSRDVCDGISNSVWEPGELVHMGAVLTAVYGDVSGIQGTLVPLNEGVTLVRPNATWPDITLGGQAASNSPHFAFRIDPDVECGTQLRFRVDLGFDQGEGGVILAGGTVGTPGPFEAPVISTDVPVSIPDDSPSGVTSELEVSESWLVGNVEVGVDIEHTWVGDLTITLYSPSGTPVVLVDRPGGGSYGCSDDDMRVLFSADGEIEAQNHCGGSNPWLTGRAIPLGDLSSYSGESIEGTWTLHVSDNAGADTGRIVAWGMRATDAAGGICEVCD